MCRVLQQGGTMTPNNQTATTADAGKESPLANTREAATFLNLQPQTLRGWASTQQGPIQPVRIGNRALRWRWADLHQLAGV